jgi:hypothetical protein
MTKENFQKRLEAGGNIYHDCRRRVDSDGSLSAESRLVERADGAKLYGSIFRLKPSERPILGSDRIEYPDGCIGYDFKHDYNTNIITHGRVEYPDGRVGYDAKNDLNTGAESYERMEFPDGRVEYDVKKPVGG